jgi:D-alanyl-D-alanine dipeptidase
MTEIVLMSDPEVAAIPVADRGEPFADVREFLAVDALRADEYGAFAHLREGVLARLLKAQELLPDGVRLLFVEGYRPPALQRTYFEEYAAGLRAANPAWTQGRLRDAASRYVSPPEIAPHSAGAAVDLTLVDADGRELDMGTRVNASPEESAGACFTDAPGIGAAARANRRLLAAALTAAGLVNYPTEWWHWSYGDRYWALATGAGHALYGPQELPVVRLARYTKADLDEITGGADDPFEVAAFGVSARDKDVHFGARSQGRLVAHAGLVEAPVEVAERRLRVAGLGGVIVAPGMRGHGLARAVVNAAVEHARGTDAEFGLLFCLPDRVPLYRRLGWRVLEGGMRVEQPGGVIDHPLHSMWIPLADDAVWPAGAARLHSLPM